MSRKRAKQTKTTSPIKAPKSRPARHIRAQRWKLFLFIGLFVLQLAVFYILYTNAWMEKHIFIPLANIYAGISGHVLSIAGYSNTVVGDVISSPSMFMVSVKKGCDAAEPMAIFLSAILAFPANIKSKFPAIAFGLMVIFLLNIIRVVSLYIIGIHFPDAFETMHIGIWQVVFIVVAMLLWFLWLQRITGKPAKT